MNWQIKQKRTKEVHIKLEWTDKSDLRLILDDLSNLVVSGVESYHGFKKSIENEEKTHLVKFEQFYVDTIQESTESDINGELRLVIKSNF